MRICVRVLSGDFPRKKFIFRIRNFLLHLRVDAKVESPDFKVDYSCRIRVSSTVIKIHFALIIVCKYICTDKWLPHNSGIPCIEFIYFVHVFCRYSLDKKNKSEK